jgi:hypothetical protein
MNDSIALTFAGMSSTGTPAMMNAFTNSRRMFSVGMTASKSGSRPLYHTLAQT